MSLTTKFREVAIAHSLGKSTVASYDFWHRKFYGFCQVPASQWTGELVRQFLVGLYDQNYSTGPAASARWMWRCRSGRRPFSYNPYNRADWNFKT